MSVHHGASGSLMVPLAPVSLGSDTVMEPSWALRATRCLGRAPQPSLYPLFTLNEQVTTGPILATDIEMENGYLVTSGWLGERREDLGSCKLGGNLHRLSTEKL